MELPAELDRLEVILLVDNQIEGFGFPSRREVVHSSRWCDINKASPARVYAGHGFSALIRAYAGAKRALVLYDAGPSSELLKHNVASLGLGLEALDAIVVSHGHWDHFGGLAWAIRQARQRPLPVHVHENAFRKRAVFRTTAEGVERKDMQRMGSPRSLQAAGADLIMSAKPQPVAGGLLLTTGEVPRATEYETGFPGQRSLLAGRWTDDEAVMDDTALIARVRGRGSVIVSGCSHAGIVNITRQAQSVTGEKQIAAIIGGLHLGGSDDKRSIPTFRDLKSMSPEVLVPCHCTGTLARFLAREAQPDAFVPSSVGTMYVIET